MKTLSETSMVSKSQDAYKIAQKAVDNPGVKFYINHQTGSGRWTKITDYEFRVRNILLWNGVIFESGNDAPRGGKLGDYIIVKA